MYSTAKLITAWLFIGLLACLVSARAYADSSAESPSLLFSEWTPFVEIDLWRASDAIPISQFNSAWRKNFSPRAGRNVALMHTRATAGVESSQWRIGYEVRQEAS